MSITRYLELKKLAQLLPQGMAERLGGRVEGPVLSGQKSLNERLSDAARPDAVQRGREFYQSTDEYDPVLRSHTRR